MSKAILRVWISGIAAYSTAVDHDVNVVLNSPEIGQLIEHFDNVTEKTNDTFEDFGENDDVDEGEDDGEDEGDEDEGDEDDSSEVGQLIQQFDNATEEINDAVENLEHQTVSTTVFDDVDSAEGDGEYEVDEDEADEDEADEDEADEDEADEDEADEADLPVDFEKVEKEQFAARIVKPVDIEKIEKEQQKEQLAARIEKPKATITDVEKGQFAAKIEKPKAKKSKATKTVVKTTVTTTVAKKPVQSSMR